MTSYICFINNYNNEKYIHAALQSVYAQTTPFDEVIVVDDGSTDNSLEIIFEFTSKYKNLRVLTKENEGQISTFNFVLPFISHDCQIFLLDGDDLYPSDYLSNVIELFGGKEWDFAFCEQQKFFSNDIGPIETSIIHNKTTFSFSKTSALTRSRGCWIGSPTSCISLSDRVFRKIFPYPFFRDRILWVDDLMIFASSILGVEKTHLGSLGVCWRSHASNITKKQHSTEDVKTRKKSIENIFQWYCTKYKIPRYPRILEFFLEFDALSPYWKKRLDLPSRYRMFNRLIRNSLLQFLSKNFTGSKVNIFEVD